MNATRDPHHVRPESVRSDACNQRPKPEPGWVDSHAHLDLEAFDADRDAVIARAREAGVTAFIVPATTRQRWALLATLASQYRWHAAYGLHPVFLEATAPPPQHHTRRARHPDLDALDHWLAQHPQAAVGEIGLDGHVAATDSEAFGFQQRVFRAQLELAEQHARPVIIHARRALDLVLQALRRHPQVRGIVHSFSGSDQQLDQLLSLGFRIGVGGPVTYARAQRLRRQVARIPDDAFLLETDAPDQPACGLQGQRHEPAAIARIAAHACELRQQSPDVLARVQRATCAALFGKPCPQRTPRSEHETLHR